MDKALDLQSISSIFDSYPVSIKLVSLVLYAFSTFAYAYEWLEQLLKMVFQELFKPSIGLWHLLTTVAVPDNILHPF